ncbi:putative zinc-binding protein [Pseudoalteromonas sp.]|uniref:putative zinc-binding protein n=1 Tax=Pseudoalteromonas sp. TaxID=53249 RepID=UPI00262C39A7|nr:putative zinc-binding protein [Pseudoalteromonas sp.]MCP4586410.1 hypothetical protein [Pseudoalteromonas sp.]
MKEQRLPILLTCSGCSHGAELAEDLSQSLIMQGKVDKVSIAALTAGSAMHWQKLASSSAVIVFDGCGLNCAKLSLEKLSINRFYHFDMSKQLNKVNCGVAKPSLAACLQVTKMVQHQLASVLPKQHRVNQDEASGCKVIAMFPCAER